LYTSFE